MPVINSKDELVRVFSKADAEKFREFPKSSLDKNGRLMVGAAIKVDENATESVELLVEAVVDVLVIEAEAKIEDQVSLLKWIKKTYSHVDVIAGNVATKEEAELFIAAGADAIRMKSSCMFLLCENVTSPNLLF